MNVKCDENGLQRKNGEKPKVFQKKDKSCVNPLRKKLSCATLPYLNVFLSLQERRKESVNSKGKSCVLFIEKRSCKETHRRVSEGKVISLTVKYDCELSSLPLFANGLKEAKRNVILDNYRH